ncbi:hypothetical protein SLA2020_518400 [Shorea laevis]
MMTQLEGIPMINIQLEGILMINTQLEDIQMMINIQREDILMMNSMQQQKILMMIKMHLVDLKTVTTTKACDYSGKQTITYNYEPRSSEHSGSYQRTEKATYVDKQTGGFTHTTAKEVISSGDTFKERGSAGRVGTKNEYMTANTLRVGDKSGYSEYQVQERFRTVHYGGNSSSKSYYGGGSSKKY